MAEPVFFRLSNPDRLFSDQRSKKEYLVGEETARARDLVVFLERFSQDTRCYAVKAQEFVAELYRRWRERNPSAEGETKAMESAPSNGTLVISYSSDDLGAAKALSEDLKEIGGDVAWFDKSALKPGDVWERQILGAIQKCSLFLPVLSTNTERRTEGYFRLEWMKPSSARAEFRDENSSFPWLWTPIAR